MKNSKMLLAFIGVFIAIIGWSLSYVWYKEVTPYLPVVTIISIRVLSAAILLFIIGKATGILKNISYKEFKYFFLIAFLEPFLYYIFEVNGISRVSATTASIIISSTPLVTFILHSILKKTIPKVIVFLALILSTVGVIVVVYFSSEDTLSTSTNETIIGILLLFGAVLSTAFFNIGVKNFAKKYSAFTIVTYQNIFGSFLMIPLFFIVDYPSLDFSTIEFSKFYIPLLELTIISTVLSFILYIYGLGKIGIVNASALMNFMPVITMISAYYMLGSVINIETIFGIILTLIGTALVIRNTKILSKNSPVNRKGILN